MKNKWMFISAAAVLLIALIAGSISGYRFPDTADKEGERDRLCGVYLTATHLDETQEQMSADYIKIMTDIEQDFMPNNESAQRWYAKRTDEGTSPEDAAFDTYSLKEASHREIKEVEQGKSGKDSGE